MWLPRVAMAASGGGSTIRKILPEVLACNGRLYGHIDPFILVVDRECGATDVWNRFDLPMSHVIQINHGDPDMAVELANAFDEYAVDVFSGHGFLTKMAVDEIPLYTTRSIVYMNQHPAPKPLVGGEDHWGKVPHRIVALYNERARGLNLYGDPLFTEAWEHYMDAEFDTGGGISVLTLPLFQGDTTESIQERVMDAEWRNCCDAYLRLSNAEEGTYPPCLESSWNEQTIDLELLERCRAEALALGPH